MRWSIGGSLLLAGFHRLLLLRRNQSFRFLVRLLADLANLRRFLLRSKRRIGAHCLHLRARILLDLFPLVHSGL